MDQRFQVLVEPNNASGQWEIVAVNPAGVRRVLFATRNSKKGMAEYVAWKSFLEGK